MFDGCDICNRFVILTFYEYFCATFSKSNFVIWTENKLFGSFDLIKLSSNYDFL